MNRFADADATEFTDTAREIVMVREIAGNGQNEAATMETTGPPMRYSIKKMVKMPWRDQIRNYTHSDTLVVQEKPDSFLNAENIPLAIPVSILSKAQSMKDDSHSVSDISIEELQDGIKNAPVVIDNPARNSLVYVTNVEDGAGLVTVAFLKNQMFDGDRVHKSTTVHIREDPMAMINSLGKDATVYVRKNELDIVPGSSLLKSGTLDTKIKFIDDSVTENGLPVKQNVSVSEDGGYQGNGYDGYSMSNNARMAYENGGSGAEPRLRRLRYGSPMSVICRNRSFISCTEVPEMWCFAAISSV